MKLSGLLVLLGLFLSTPVFAIGQLTDVRIYDRKTNNLLPVYEYEGRYFVAGEPGHEYSLRLSSRSGGRLLAVTSVDGVNVISGETAAPDQTGYVLDPWSGTDIAGWRKSMERIAAFYFTRLKNSYAARTGRPNDVGVIGVALFRERMPEPPPVPCCWPFRSDRSESESRDQASGAASPEAARESAPAQAQRKSERLGTGHGRSEQSVVSYTDFERASSTPDEVIAIYYDSHRNLLAQGVIPQPRYASTGRPSPFPGSFVPDP
ncbi:MAG: hypothetical protein ACRES4_01915 [Nevskiales bacterium]